MKIKVDLLPEDFENFIFVSKTKCPLAKALKRKFPNQGYNVGLLNVFYDYTLEKAYKINYFVDWNPVIANKVRQCYKQGDKTIYYVELTKV